MKLEKMTTTSILVFLLIYVFMAGNTSGEFMLCIGANWHIAFEPLSHGYFYDRQHIEQHESSSPGDEYYGHWAIPHCKSCIDIPIFVGPNNNRFPLEPIKKNSGIFVSLLETTADSDYQFVLQANQCRPYLCTDENCFLRSIILLV